MSLLPSRIVAGAAVSLLLTATVAAAPAAAAPAVVLSEPFDAVSRDWISVGAGQVALEDAGDRTEGAGALSVAYDVSAGYVEIERRTTPAVLADEPVSAIMIDLRGDATYNTVYVKLRDASGEFLMYRVAAMASASWSTVTVDLTEPPAASELGNADGVIDYPVVLSRVLVARNGSQPATGTAVLDNLRVVSEGWSLPASSSDRFSPTAGEQVNLSFDAGRAGDYELVLSDQGGRSKVFSGTAAAGSSVVLAWGGKDESGGALAGAVSARLRFDDKPNGRLDSNVTVAQRSFLVGASARTSLVKQTSIVGVNSFLTTIDSSVEVDRQAALMEDAYVRYAREEFEWNRVEPRQGYFDWAKFDQAVDAAYSRNIDIVGKLVYTAGWASSAPAGTPAADARFYPPRDIADYVDYAAAVVSRYKERVGVWEIWNEPDTALYWKPAPDPIAYAEMLALVYDAIKSVDPEAVVLVGGLAGFSEPYMQAVVDHGAKNSFDGIAVHPYSFERPESGMFGLYLDAADSFLTRNRLDRTVWITEVGWTTCVQCAGSTSEFAQAKFLSRTFIDAAARGVAGVMWYALVTSGADPRSRLDNFGITERDGTLKPAYAALQDVGAAFDQALGAGEAAPQKGGGNTVVSDFASVAGMTAIALDGGTASLNATTARWSGKAGLSLRYDFAGKSRGATIAMTQTLPNQPSSISVWVYGDGSNSPIYLEFSDATGERFRALVGHAGAEKWKKLTLYSDGANPQYSYAGGDRDGRWDYPLTVTGISMYEATSGKSSGTVYIDDLSVGYGPPVRGAVLKGRRGVVQALYSLGPSTSGAVSIPGDSAWLRSSAGDAPLVLKNGMADVPLSAEPAYVASGIGVSPAVGNSGSVFVASWLGGNTYYASAQVYGPQGFVRTLFYRARYSAGPRVVGWNGRGADGALAPAGDYVFRVWLHGADGQTTVVSEPFVVEGS